MTIVCATDQNQHRPAPELFPPQSLKDLMSDLVCLCVCANWASMNVPVKLCVSMCAADRERMTCPADEHHLLPVDVAFCHVVTGHGQNICAGYSTSTGLCIYCRFPV